jgi:hypothetical protein
MVLGGNGGTVHRGKGEWTVALQRMFSVAFIVMATIPLMFQQSSYLSSLLPAKELVFSDVSSAFQTDNFTENPASAGSRRCAINFWGLPRAFSQVVLPSIVENVIKVNAPYKCDYFIHYNSITEEAAGRSGRGGTVNATEILLLEREVKMVHNEAIVQFESTTNDEFLSIYGDLLNMLRTTMDPVTKKYKYYPWKSLTYEYPTTMDNIIRMWHTIQSAFQLMDEYGQSQQTSQPYYHRVAMLRSDVFYLTPVDIYSLDDRSPPDVTPSLLQQEWLEETRRRQEQQRAKDGGKTDTTSVVDLIPRPMESLYRNLTESAVWQDVNNEYSVLPAFGKYPVSDRMIYGPYEAVKLWSSQRFSRLENHAAMSPPGLVLHSEKFVNRTILAAIQTELKVRVVEHPTVCFLRARPDQSIWMNDCEIGAELSKKSSVWNNYHSRASKVAKSQMRRRPGNSTQKSVKLLVEHILQRACTGPTKLKRGILALDCSVK